MLLASLISYGQAIVLGLLQGVSELFPVSSLGHSVILPKLLGWNIHQNDKYFITFLVATHLATALVLLGFFWRDAELLRRRAPQVEEDDDARIARRMSWLGAFGVGAAQALALIPGFSRSGATMGGGLLVGLSNKDAARFAFLLATPIIGAAAVLKLPDLFGSQGNGVRGQALVGALCSAVTAYLAVRFLMRFFETNTLVPFAVYCAAAGLAASLYFAF